MKEPICRAAGIIIYRKRNLKHEILGLISLPKFQLKNNGIFDIPKGMIDPGEDPETCARRECYEETKLKPLNLQSGPHKGSFMWLWLAECDKTPILETNPKTGLFEHLGYRWLDIDYIIENCLDYLKPGLLWAKEELQKQEYV